MLFRLFSRNNPLAYLAVAAVLVLLRLRLIMTPEFYVIGDQTGLYAPLWNTVFGHVEPASFLSVVLALVATMLCALLVNNIVNRFGLVPQQGVAAGLFFVVLAGGLRHSIAFQPIIIYSLFFVWALDRLFSAMRKESPYASVGWGFAIATTGSLFWAKGIWLLPLLFLVLFVIRQSSVRCLAAAFVGIVGVAFVAASVDLFVCNPVIDGRLLLRSAFDTQALWKIGAFSISYMSIVLLLVLWATLSTQRHLVEMTIQESRRMRVAEWIVFLSIFFITLPGFSYEMQILFAVGASMFLPSFALRLRSDVMRDLFLALLIGVTAWIIYV